MISFGGGSASLNARNNLLNVQRDFNTSLRRLSSGLRINSAGDDPAGLAISEKLQSQIRSLSRAEQNAYDGVSLAQTASGALDEVSDVLTRMREIATQSANDTLSDDDRDALQAEFNELRSEVDRIASVTEFNGIKLLDGTADVDVFVGIQNTSDSVLSLMISNVHSSSIGGSSVRLDDVNVSSVSTASSSLTTIDDAIADISAIQARIGAMENRLNVAISNLSVTRENLSAANSRIRDADIAEETANFTRTQILMKAGASVLVQANDIGLLALTLLGASG